MCAGLLGRKERAGAEKMSKCKPHREVGATKIASKGQVSLTDGTNGLDMAVSDVERGRRDLGDSAFCHCHRSPVQASRYSPSSCCRQLCPSLVHATHASWAEARIHNQGRSSFEEQFEDRCSHLQKHEPQSKSLHCKVSYVGINLSSSLIKTMCPG